MVETRLRFAVASDHPALAGHFPGAPILPGAVLLDWAWQACRTQLPAGAVLAGVVQAKFLSPALPGDTLDFSVELHAEQLTFRCHAGDRRVAQGRFAWKPA
ncbi:MAG: hypothetical protein AABY95_07975 [Pseudomonadota bacterium]